MNPASTATTPFPTTDSDLIRRLGDLEVPAPGQWSLVPTSHVAIALGQLHQPTPLRVINGGFDIADRPDDSTIRLELTGPDPMTFLGRPTMVARNRQGMSDWWIAGTLTHHGRPDTTLLTISYHGVFRTRGRAWAWFSGTGALETPDTTRWRRSQRVERRPVVLDLLFDSPSPPTSRAMPGRRPLDSAA